MKEYSLMRHTLQNQFELLRTRIQRPLNPLILVRQKFDESNLRNHLVQNGHFLVSSLLINLKFSHYSNYSNYSKSKINGPSEPNPPSATFRKFSPTWMIKRS